MHLDLGFKKKKNVCEWNIACVLLILCFFPLNCEFDLKCDLYIKKKRHGNMIYFYYVCFALGELFIVVRFVADVTRQNTLPQVKDVQLPHYCI